MRTLRLGAALAALFVVTLCVSFALSQEKKPQDRAAMAGAEDQEAQMAAWIAYAQVGPEHHQLQKHFEGTWDAEVKSFFGPPEVTKGTSVNKMILGGRYLQSNYNGTNMGQPFEGLGLTGFDNAKKKYFGTWVDSMGTGVMVTEGTYEEATKTYTFGGDMTTPDGGSTTIRELVKIIDDNKHTFDMFMTDKDGQEQQVMAITYTRKN